MKFFGMLLLFILFLLVVAKRDLDSRITALAYRVQALEGGPK